MTAEPATPFQNDAYWCGALSAALRSAAAQLKAVGAVSAAADGQRVLCEYDEYARSQGFDRPHTVKV